MIDTEGKRPLDQTQMEETIMALSDLAAWNNEQETASAAACGSTCGAADKP